MLVTFSSANNLRVIEFKAVEALPINYGLILISFKLVFLDKVLLIKACLQHFRLFVHHLVFEILGVCRLRPLEVRVGRWAVLWHQPCDLLRVQSLMLNLFRHTSVFDEHGNGLIRRT